MFSMRVMSQSVCIRDNSVIGLLRRYVFLPRSIRENIPCGPSDIHDMLIYSCYHIAGEGRYIRTPDIAHLRPESLPI